MEFGALICKPTNPLCNICNLRSDCYFFKNRNSFYNFIRNLSENCKVGGLCIGTCYDGKKIFNSLRSKKKEESIILMNNDVKVWEINKLYGHEDFKNDKGNLELVYNTKKYGILCERRFEVDSNSIVIGFVSNGCF